MTSEPRCSVCTTDRHDACRTPWWCSTRVTETVPVLLSCGCEDDLPNEDTGHPWQVGEATLCDCTTDGLVYVAAFRQVDDARSQP